VWVFVWRSPPQLPLVCFVVVCWAGRRWWYVAGAVQLADASAGSAPAVSGPLRIALHDHALAVRADRQLRLGIIPAPQPPPLHFLRKVPTHGCFGATALCVCVLYTLQVVGAARRDRAACDVCRRHGGIARFCSACDWDICDACFATVSPPAPSRWPCTVHSMMNCPAVERMVGLDVLWGNVLTGVGPHPHLLAPSRPCYHECDAP
jgi:hypothetical protein